MKFMPIIIIFLAATAKARRTVNVIPDDDKLSKKYCGNVDVTKAELLLEQADHLPQNLTIRATCSVTPTPTDSRGTFSDEGVIKLGVVGPNFIKKKIMGSKERGYRKSGWRKLPALKSFIEENYINNALSSTLAHEVVHYIQLQSIVMNMYVSTIQKQASMFLYPSTDSTFYFRTLLSSVDGKKQTEGSCEWMRGIQKEQEIYLKRWNEIKSTLFSSPSFHALINRMCPDNVEVPAIQTFGETNVEAKLIASEKLRSYWRVDFHTPVSVESSRVLTAKEIIINRDEGRSFYALKTSMNTTEYAEHLQKLMKNKKDIIPPYEKARNMQMIMANSNHFAEEMAHLYEGLPDCWIRQMKLDFLINPSAGKCSSGGVAQEGNSAAFFDKRLEDNSRHAVFSQLKSSVINNGGRVLDSSNDGCGL